MEAGPCIRTTMTQDALEAELDREWATVRADFAREGKLLPETRAEAFVVEPREAGLFPVDEFLLKVAESVVSGLMVTAIKEAVMAVLKRIRWRRGPASIELDGSRESE
jgi:hypothetical protein